MSPDPYEAIPTFWERNAGRIAPVAVCVLTAVLGVVSFPPFDAPAFAYACLVPGLFWAYSSPPFKVYAWTMAAGQAIAWTILLGWLHHVTWLGLFLLGPFVGVWTGLWYVAAWWTLPRMAGRSTPTRMMALLGLAGAWVLVEWTRTWFLGGFEWLPLAASQWKQVSMLQVAAYAGAYGVSFVIVAVNVGFTAYAHRLLREKAVGLNRRSQEFLLSLFIVLACFCVFFTDVRPFDRARFRLPFARVAFVQPDIAEEVKWDPAKIPGIARTLQQTTLAAASTHPDLILWPEAVTPLPVRGDPSMERFVASLTARAGAPILFGSVAEEPGRAASGAASTLWYNAAFVATPEAGVRPTYYAKRKLVPFGEYVPLRPLLGWLSKFVPIGEGDFSRGNDPSPLVIGMASGATAFGTLICYEDTYPQLARSEVRSGADILAVLTNNAWFGEGGAAYQHAAHSVLRAVETRRPVLRCGNAGWSGWIDEFGNTRAVLTNHEGTIYFRGTATISISRDARWINRDSFYVIHGDWFVAVSAALALFTFLLLVSTPVEGGMNREQKKEGQ